MSKVDLEEAKYVINRLAREYDSQTSVLSIEEVYDGEFYKLTFQRGYHSYIQEIGGERFAGWFEQEDPPQDMIDVVKLAVEELAT